MTAALQEQQKDTSASSLSFDDSAHLARDNRRIKTLLKDSRPGWLHEAENRRPSAVRPVGTVILLRRLCWWWTMTGRTRWPQS